MAPESPNRLSWEEYRFHLTAELERMSGILETMSDKLNAIQAKQSNAERDTKWIGSIFGFCAAALVEVGRVVAALIIGHSK